MHSSRSSCVSMLPSLHMLYASLLTHSGQNRVSLWYVYLHLTLIPEKSIIPHILSHYYGVHFDYLPALSLPLTLSYHNT